MQHPQPPTPRQATPAKLLSSRRSSTQLPVEVITATIIKYVDPSTGWPYFYDTVTGESSYDRPTGFQTAASPFQSGQDQSTGPSTGEDYQVMEPAAMLSTRRKGNERGVEQGGDWVKYVDPETGHPYYYNAKTDVSQYERPQTGYQTVRRVSNPAMTVSQRARSEQLALYNAGCELRSQCDYAGAGSIFKKLSRDNHPLASHNLAIMYQKGLGMQPDLVEAMKLYSVAAEKGIPESQYALGVLVRDVMGDFDEGDALFELAAEQGHELAMFNLGVQCEASGQWAEAIEWYRASAEKGVVKAAVNLGRLLVCDEGNVDDDGFKRVPYQSTSEEKIEGGRWLKVAADAKDPTALFNLAIKCKKEEKILDMVEYLEKASEGGHVAASYNYAKSLIRGEAGEGKKEDLDRAADLLNFCADEGDPKATRDARKLMKSMRVEEKERANVEMERREREEREAGEVERLRLEGLRIQEAQKEMEKGLAAQKKQEEGDEDEDEAEEKSGSGWGDAGPSTRGKPTNDAVMRVKAAVAKRKAEKERIAREGGC